jgi:hypothetical protein
VSERLGDVGIVGDEKAALHKDAKGRPEFVKVGRGNHAADGVQVFVSEADAQSVHFKAKKDAVGVSDRGLGGV